MNAVDLNRLKAWQALSQFFLDTEVDQATFNHVAKEIQEIGYTLAEVHSILWLEVFPVLQGNLKAVAGEWGVGQMIGYSSTSLYESLFPPNQLGGGSVMKSTGAGRRSCAG